MAILPGYPGISSGSTMSGKDIVDKLKLLSSPNKLPASSVEGVVMSVNSQTGNVHLTAESLNAQPVNTQLTRLASATLNPNSMLWVNADGTMGSYSPTSYAMSLMQLSNPEAWQSMLHLGSFATMDLDESGHIPISILSEDFSEVAFTGSYKDLTDKPDNIGGVSSVNGNTGNVDLSYSDVGAAQDIHTHDIQDINNLSTALFNKMDKTGTINYSQITGMPDIPAAQVQADWTQTDLNAPSYIKNKPQIPVINYPVTSVNSKTGGVQITSEDVGAAPVIHNHKISDVTGLQSALDGKLALGSSIPYSTITDAPTIPVVNYPVTSVNSKKGDVTLNSDDVGAATKVHTHAISDVQGLRLELDSKISNGSSIPYSSLTGTPTIPAAQVQSDWSQSNTASPDYIKNKPTIPVVNYPVTSVNSKTGAVSLTNTDVGAAATVHTHEIKDVTGLETALNNKMAVGSTVPYSNITGTPTIPVNNTFTLKGLSDTDDVAVANGFFRWNSTGTSVSYSTTIPYSAISGTPILSTVATSGSYADLLNKPTIPATTSQITEGTNLYYTDARVLTLMGNNGVRRVETLQGTTNASGVYQVVFGNTYSTPPHVNPFIINGTAAQTVLVSNITTTGCTITVVQRAAVTLLAVEVLLASTTPVSGVTVGVLVVSKT